LLGILALELCILLDGDGAFVSPVAFVFAMEITEWYFLSSAAIVSSAFVVSPFAKVTIIAAGSFIMTVPLAFPPVMVSGVSRFFFGNVVHCFLMLRLISVTWF